MFGCTLDYPHQLYRIETLTSLGSFGPTCGGWWTPNWKEARHFTLRPTDRQRLLTVPWYTYYEAIVGNIPRYGMNISPRYSIPTTEQCIHRCIIHHSRLVLVTCQRTLLIWSLEGRMALVDIMIGTKLSSSFNECESGKKNKCLG